MKGLCFAPITTGVLRGTSDDVKKVRYSMTALRLYGSNTVDTSISVNSCAAVVAPGSPGTTTVTTKIGSSATGYDRLKPQGDTGAWNSFVGIQVPSGQGFVLPHGTLSLSQMAILHGNWTPQVAAVVSNGTIGCTLIVVGYVYNSTSGTYGSAFATSTLTGQTITTTPTTFSLPAVSIGNLLFGWDDYLYYEIWCRVITNSTGNSNATIGLVLSNSGSVGSDSATYLDTQGYNPIDYTYQYL